MFIAGDDDQAIHRWTGVDVKLFNKSSTNVKFGAIYRIPKVRASLARHIANGLMIGTKEFDARDEEGRSSTFTTGGHPVARGSWTIMARTNGYVYDLAKHIQEQGLSIRSREGPASH